MRFLAKYCHVVLPVLMLVVATQAGAADPKPASEQLQDPAFVASIRKLLVLSNAEKLGIQILDQMIPALQKAVPQAPNEFWEGFRNEVKPGELTELVIPIYARHFTRKEIEDIVQFYESPIGQRLVHEQTGIVQESMALGRQWGGKMAQRAIEKLKAAGYPAPGADAVHTPAKPHPAKR